MIKLYIRQAWQLLKQNRLFSSIYILGTGLAIAMIVTLVIIYYVKMAPVYPEMNRDRTLVCKGLLVRERSTVENWSSSLLSYQTVCDYFYPQKGAEAVTAIMNDYASGHSIIEFSNEDVREVQLKYTDANFWRVFTFSFVSGKPFTETDFQSALRKAVVSERMARQLFGEEEAVGQTFVLNSDEFRVCGVVRDVSSLTPTTYADVWIPYTIFPDATKKNTNRGGMLGSMEVYILAPDQESVERIADEVRDDFRKFNFSQKEFFVQLNGQPVPYWKSVFYEYSSDSPDWGELLKTFGTILLALLFIPALNLAGMISSRMDRRLSELGIRKAFGASKRILLGQVLTENLLLTGLGGIVGLLLSYGMVYFGRNWLPTLFSDFVDVIPENVDTFFTVGMLLNPTVFIITFAICFLLNVLSALIPAMSALKKDIIYSLNDKR